MEKLNIDLTELANNSNNIGIYAFHDIKAKRFDTPFYCQNDMFAGRHYKMLIDKEGTMLNKFKTEFNVYRLGWFDSISGEFTDNRELIIEGKNLIQEESK